MLVPGIDSIPQDPSIPVTGGLHGVGEDVFMLPFPKPVALRVSHAALTGLAPSLPALPLLLYQRDGRKYSTLSTVCSGQKDR